MEREREREREKGAEKLKHLSGQQGEAKRCAGNIDDDVECRGFKRENRVTTGYHEHQKETIKDELASGTRFGCCSGSLSLAFTLLSLGRRQRDPNLQGPGFGNLLEQRSQHMLNKEVSTESVNPRVKSEVHSIRSGKLPPHREDPDEAVVEKDLP